MLRYILLASVVSLASSGPVPPSMMRSFLAEEPALPIPAPLSKPAPASNPSPVASNPAPAAPVPAPKALSLVSEIKTPASTAKLAHLVAPLGTPLISPISRIAYVAPSLPQVSPYAYAYSPALAPIEIAAAPTSYSIEQHGYHITY